MFTEINPTTVRVLRLREGAIIPLRVIAEIIQRSAQTGWDNKYTDYNERWIDKPAWQEHIDKWDNKWDKKP